MSEVLGAFVLLILWRYIMQTDIEQYELETSWSTRMTDEIVLEAIQGHIPFSMEQKILDKITAINRG